MRPFAAENNLLDLTDIDALIVCLGGELDSIDEAILALEHMVRMERAQGRVPAQRTARPGASPRRIAKRPASHRPRSIQ
jgi:hypothetical protein